MVDDVKAAQYKQEIREEWTVAAPGWKKWDAVLTESMREVSDRLLEAAELKPRMQVLDLASGTGEPALQIARTVGPDGRVVATDLVPDMLRVAEEKAREADLGNFECRQSDAESLPFEDGSFDAVTCRFGIMFFPQVEKALAEVRRVLKPGGRAAFAAWGPLEGNPFFSVPMVAVAKHGVMPPPDPERPNVFKFASPGSLEAAIAGAFPMASEQRLNVTMDLRVRPEERFQALVDIAAPFRRMLESLPEDAKLAVEREIADNSVPFWDGSTYRIPAQVVIGVGVKGS
ncbi:MAG: class I SAM-dependent methyltransferase [Chloroflexi bacterium]|nr:class I SAM-dependent methyltransferase [Chloroflexota bacterium]